MTVLNRAADGSFTIAEITKTGCCAGCNETAATPEPETILQTESTADPVSDTPAKPTDSSAHSNNPTDEVVDDGTS